MAENPCTGCKNRVRAAYIEGLADATERGTSSPCAGGCAGRRELFHAALVLTVAGALIVFALRMLDAPERSRT